jgi:ClpP class serine protease
MLDPQSLEIISGLEWFVSDRKNTYRIYNDVAVIPIHGLLTKRAELFDSFFGTTSYDEIHELISSAIENSQANSILLDIDSPGGEVSGLFDLVDFIYESRNIKPICAFANDHAFSAAYAIASAASKIFVNRTSGVGSIGVIATHIDISEHDKKEGIKYTTILRAIKKMICLHMNRFQMTRFQICEKKWIVFMECLLRRSQEIESLISSSGSNASGGVLRCGSDFAWFCGSA